MNDRYVEEHVRICNFPFMSTYNVCEFGNYRFLKEKTSIMTPKRQLHILLVPFLKYNNMFLKQKRIMTPKRQTLRTVQCCVAFMF